MSNYSIALRYDKSLLQLALEQGVLEDVHKDMLLIDKTFRENKMLTMLVKSPMAGHQKKLNVLKALYSGKVNKLTMGLFEILVRKNREDLLPEIATIFHQQYNQHKGIAEATVVTQYPIDVDERKSMVDLVKKHTGAKSVELIEQINPNMIGGFVLKIGDKQIDNSLDSRLKELKIKFES